MTRFFIIYIICFCVLALHSFREKAEHYDVCIYGGTSAGVIAAYSVAKMGKRVVLIEPGTHLGGLSQGVLVTPTLVINMQSPEYPAISIEE